MHPAVRADSPNHSSHQGFTPRAKISRIRSIAEPESSSGANRLQRSRRKAASARSDRSRKGWSAERRARQAALVRSWAPWQNSTGPKTAAGKARSAMNALKHGRRSQAKIREYQRIRYVLRLAAQNIERLRLHIRLRDARLRIKYKFPPISARSVRRTETNTTSPPHPELVEGCGEGSAAPSGNREPQPWRFRPPPLGTRIGPTHLVHVVREEHRWPSASP